jgi:SPP1 family predicted phage head-tail adaptor
MLNASDLAGMRDTVEGSLPETATILRRTVTSDGIGGRTEQFIASGTCAARIMPVSTLAKEVAARIVSNATHVIITPSDTSISPGDRLQIDDRVFHVIEGTVSGTWDIVRRLSVAEI